MTDKPLAGKVALVTGAGRGMGRSIALTLARAGACVSIVSRTAAELLAVHAEIEAGGGSAIALPTDVSVEIECIALVRETTDRLGRLDILVNNAGIGAGGPWETTPPEIYDYVMAVNARAPYLLCHEAIPHLRAVGGGHIINILSYGGVVCNEGYGIYSVSKNALRALTITLSKDLRRDNIRVHAINMGAVDTPLLRKGLDYRPDLSLERLIQPEEIADIVMFLVTWRGKGVIDEINIRRPDASYWAAI